MGTEKTDAGGGAAALRKKQRRRIALYAILAAVLIGATVYGVWSYLSPKRVTVWLFREGHKAGEVLTESMLYPVQADASIIVAGGQASTASQFVTGSDIRAVANSGDSLRMDVAAGMPLTRAMLSVTGGTAVELNLDPSKVAITVSANPHSGVTNDLLPGSYLNVYATGYAAGGQSTSTVLLFQRQRVLGTTKSNGSLSGITLEMDVMDSLKLVNALNYAAIYFALVDSYGYAPVADSASYTPQAATATQATGVPDAYPEGRQTGEAAPTPTAGRSQQPAD